MFNFREDLGDVDTLDSQKENNQPRKKPDGSDERCVSIRWGRDEEVAEDEVGDVGNRGQRYAYTGIECKNQGHAAEGCHRINKVTQLSRDGVSRRA